jgi:hypothetical protein
MADQSETGDTHAEPGPKPTTGGMPRWVKVLILVGIVLVLAAIVLSLLFGIKHGPGLHTPPTDGGGHTPFMEHGP